MTILLKPKNRTRYSMFASPEHPGFSAHVEVFIGPLASDFRAIITMFAKDCKIIF